MKQILARTLFSVSITVLALIQAAVITACIFLAIWLVIQAFSEPPWYSIFYVLGGFASLVAASYLTDMEATIFTKWAQFVQSRFS